MPAFLSDRLAAIKDKEAARKKNISPDFTFTHFLYIYHQAKKDSYINYMEGAVELYLFLSGDSNKGLDLEVSRFPNILNESYPLAIFNTWELCELAKILETLGASDFVSNCSANNKYTKDIAITLYESVIPLVYRNNMSRNNIK